MRRMAILLAAALAACGQITAEAPAPDSAPTSWDARLVELLPYIDACIAKTPGTRWVSYAGPTAEGEIGVRLLGDAGGYDCRAPTGDPAATRSMPRAEALEIDGEGAAIFVRGPGENPGGECYEAPEVRGPDGELLGWMADPEGC
jgi:hypothetical protein